MQRMDSGKVTRFNPKHDYPQGCTDYARWKQAQVLVAQARASSCNLHVQVVKTRPSMLSPSTVDRSARGLSSMQEPYTITYCRRYEPWGIADRRHMPWFDVRFRGYGRNKIVFTAALNASGFAFEVRLLPPSIDKAHGAAVTCCHQIKQTETLTVLLLCLQVDDASFVIHRPHEASSGSFAFSSDAALQGHIVGMYTEQVPTGQNSAELLWVQLIWTPVSILPAATSLLRSEVGPSSKVEPHCFREQLSRVMQAKKGVFTQVLDDTITRCRSTLPWWQ